MSDAKSFVGRVRTNTFTLVDRGGMSKKVQLIYELRIERIDR